MPSLKMRLQLCFPDCKYPRVKISQWTSHFVPWIRRVPPNSPINLWQQGNVATLLERASPSLNLYKCEATVFNFPPSHMRTCLKAGGFLIWQTSFIQREMKFPGQSICVMTPFLILCLWIPSVYIWALIMGAIQDIIVKKERTESIAKPYISWLHLDTGILMKI